MQQSRRDDIRRSLEAGQAVGNRKRMHNIQTIAGFSQGPAVHLGRRLIGFYDNIRVVPVLFHKRCQHFHQTFLNAVEAIVDSRVFIDAQPSVFQNAHARRDVYFLNLRKHSAALLHISCRSSPKDRFGFFGWVLICGTIRCLGRKKFCDSGTRFFAFAP